MVPAGAIIVLGGMEKGKNTATIRPGTMRITGLARASILSHHDFRHVRDHIQSAIGSEEATGIAVAVVRHGQIIWEEGFGWANRERGLRTTPHTAFSLASLSKPFTATLLAILARDGMLSLDAPANAYLGSDRLQGVDADNATVRELGAHAAGLPSLFEMYFSDEKSAAPLAGEILRKCGTLAYQPGKLCEYSNVGYLALGAIASKLTRSDFGTALKHRVLSPLGLRDSFLAPSRRD